MSPDEASTVSHLIEHEAFAAAGGSAASDNDGIEVLQVYSKEIKKLCLISSRPKLLGSDESFLGCLFHQKT